MARPTYDTHQYRGDGIKILSINITETILLYIYKRHNKSVYYISNMV